MDRIYQRPPRKAPNGPPTDEARNQEFIRLFCSGMTSREIGDAFGVHQNLVSYTLRKYGVKRSEGGKEVAARLKRAAAIEAKRIAGYTRRGVAPADFSGHAQFVEATARFKQQKSRAVTRKVGWELTFAEWWAIWRESGQWQQRGRSKADSAVMARRGDVGPYSAGNVYITTLSNNFVESHMVRGHRTKGLAGESQVSFRSPVFAPECS